MFWVAGKTVVRQTIFFLIITQVYLIMPFLKTN